MCIAKPKSWTHGPIPSGSCEFLSTRWAVGKKGAKHLPIYVEEIGSIKGHVKNNFSKNSKFILISRYMHSYSIVYAVSCMTLSTNDCMTSSRHARFLRTYSLNPMLVLIVFKGHACIIHIR